MSQATQPLSVEQLSGRFDLGPRQAAAFMRRLRHVEVAGQWFTTEEWLAEWLAAESVPQGNWPKQNIDPLEEAVSSRVIQVIGELARAGQIKVVAV